jgi:hypothetical protein
MAKKRRKPKAKKRAKRVPKPKPKPKPRSFRIREDKLRPIMREAARAGLVEAIEHASNFWHVSDGYKKYIDQQITSQAEALMAAVKTALRQELRKNARLRRKRTRK